MATTTGKVIQNNPEGFYRGSLLDIDDSTVKDMVTIQLNGGPIITLSNTLGKALYTGLEVKVNLEINKDRTEWIYNLAA